MAAPSAPTKRRQASEGSLDGIHDRLSDGLARRSRRVQRLSHTCSYLDSEYKVVNYEILELIFCTRY